jgi:hypothetical protein
MPISRRSQADSGGVSKPPPELPKGSFWATLPDLVSFLSLCVWEDGSSRTPGTLMLMVEGGAWKCWLHDRDAGMGCFVTGQSPEACLKAADKAVGLDGGDWRPDKKPGTRRP